MAGALNQRDLAPAGLKIVLKKVLSNRLPIELLDDICLYIHPFRTPPWATTTTSNGIAQHPALTPPANGRCMIEELPTELKRKLFASFLPDKDVIIRPLCQTHVAKQDPKRKPKHNAVSDLMLLSKRFKDDVTRCVYGERIFAIHVHEGIWNGGIEFLNAGRQPLHYKATIHDTRFERFNDGEFGFDKLKKVEIILFPSTVGGRHNAMTTYYINHALVRMLERSGKDDRIVSLTIKFAEDGMGSAQASHTRRQIAHTEHPWWNQDLDQPRCTSINGISDVELALRPFAMLSTVHDVRIYLPSKVKHHTTTARFTADLELSMKSNTALGTLRTNDNLDRQAESMRAEIESFIFHKKYGYKDDEVPDLTEQDYFEDEAARLAMKQLEEDGHDMPILTEQERYEDEAAGAEIAEMAQTAQTAQTEFDSQDEFTGQEYLDEAARQNLARLLAYESNNHMDVDGGGGGGDDDDDDNLIFVRSQSARGSMWKDDEEEGEIAVEQSAAVFMGVGHTLRRSSRLSSSLSRHALFGATDRTVTEDEVKKEPGSTNLRLFTFVDENEQNDSNARYKHSLQRGVSALDVDNLDITGGDEMVNKTLKRDLEDSPGRSRNSTSGGFVDLTVDADEPGRLDMASLARAREQRRTNAMKLQHVGWT